MNVELYEIVLEKFQNHGAGETLIQRLARYGEKPFLAWVSHTLCKDTEGPITSSLEALAMMLNVPYHRVRYAYFSSSYGRIAELKSRHEYKMLRATVESEFPFPKLWDNLLPYFYRQAKDLAVETLLRSDIIGATEIAMRLNVSKSQVYKIQKRYVTRTKNRRVEEIL